MLHILIPYLNAAILLLEIVAFVDLLITFKRPLILKIIILIILSCFAIRSFGELYATFLGYNRWLRVTPNIVLMVCSLCLFSFLYHFKITKYVLLYSIVALLTNFIFLSYFSFVIHIPNSVRMVDLIQYRGLLLFIKNIFVITGLYFNIYTVIQIIRQADEENLYSKKFRYWSLFIIINAVICTIAANAINYSFLNDGRVQLIISVSSLSQILLFLFRPRFMNNSNLKISLSGIFRNSSSIILTPDRFVIAFFHNTYYLNADANAAEFCKSLEIEQDEFPNFIIAQYGMTFTDLVNKSRVNYFIDLIRSEKFRLLTIEALAKESGFGSRQNLYKSFKRHHGGSPTDLIVAMTA